MDVYHTSTQWCGLRANLECMSEMCCMRLAENTGRKKSPFCHHRTTLSGYFFRTKARIDNRKKNLLNIDTSSICPDNMVNFGPLTAEIRWQVWGTPANFNGFRVFGRVTARHCSSTPQPNFAAFNRGTTYIRQGGHHVGNWPTF